MKEPLKNKTYTVDRFESGNSGSYSVYKNVDVKFAVAWLKNILCQKAMIENKLCKKDNCSNCRAIDEAFPDFARGKLNES